MIAKTAAAVIPLVLVIGCASGHQAASDVLAIGRCPEETACAGGGYKAKYSNWYRRYSSETGAWIQVLNAGGPGPDLGDVRSDCQRYLARTDGADFHFVGYRTHAYLWMLDFDRDPSPGATSRVGNRRRTLWYDARQRAVVAETRDE
jgi:hypothetical protein